jgi:hypothetical protein
MLTLIDLLEKLSLKDYQLEFVQLEVGKAGLPPLFC